MQNYNRKAYQQLVEWRASTNRKPLIIRGARQVGKTTLVNQFKTEFSESISLNLEKKKDKALFLDYPDVETFIQAIKLRFNLKQALADTLLFIDEIQESPEAIAMLRYFYEDFPELHVIVAGSLLEFALDKISNFPVGRVSFLNIHPFDFEEYLMAIGNTSLLRAFKQTPANEVAHPMLINEFHVYTMVGGMPEAISTYIQTKDISQVNTVLSNIWETYKGDVEKYAKNKSQQAIIKHIMNTAGLEKDRFSFANFGGSNYSSREVKEAFNALVLARIFKIVYPTTSLDFPILPNLKKRPRLQFLDVGLLNSSINLYMDYLKLEDLNAMHKGRIAQQIVMQELIATGSIKQYEPYFWIREKADANAEVDLIYSFKNKTIPVEIKSGKSGTLKSLHQYINTTGAPIAIRLYSGKFSIETTETPKGTTYKLLNIPYYHAASIEKYLE